MQTGFLGGCGEVGGGSLGLGPGSEPEGLFAVHSLEYKAAHLLLSVLFGASGLT